MVESESKRKETESKIIAMATTNYKPWRVFYGVKCPCKVSIALLHSFQRYAWFSVFILTTHLGTSSLPNLHIRRNLNISGRKKDIAKKNFFLLLWLFFFLLICNTNTTYKILLCTTYNTVLYYIKREKKKITILRWLITKTKRIPNIMYNTNTMSTMATKQVWNYYVQIKYKWKNGLDYY